MGLRKGRNLEESIKSSLTHMVSSHFSLAETTASFLTVNAAMSHLDKVEPELGKILELRFFEDLELSEVAADLGLSIKQIRTRIEKGKEIMKQYILDDLNDEHGENA